MHDVHGQLHHLELWVSDLDAVEKSWGWLLGELGYREYQRWDGGVSWRRGEVYIVAERSPALRPGGHDRLRPGLNHLAFHVSSRAEVDRLVRESGGYGWRLLFADRHPYAGGPDTYAGYLEDEQGFEVELVAASG